MVDSIKEALETGVSVDETPQATPNTVQKTEASPATEVSKETVQVKESTGGVAKPTTEQEPFHKNPRFQALIKENKSLSDKVANLERKYQENLEQVVRGHTQKVDQTLPPDQRQALLQLVNLIKNDPDAARELGLNRSQELEAKFQELSSSRAMDSFNAEFNSVSELFSKQFGIDKSEIEEELTAYIEANPYFGSVEYSKGMLEAAARNLYWEKLGELKEKEINLRLLKEKELKNSANVETSSSGKTNTGKPMEKNVEQFLARRISEDGGISID